MPLRAIILVLLVLRVGARRVTLMLMLALVLSALEVERRGPIERPSPIVVVLTDPPGPKLRARPYRAHHRNSHFHPRVS
jgi:hypothetical protein